MGLREEVLGMVYGVLTFGVCPAGMQIWTVGDRCLGQRRAGMDMEFGGGREGQLINSVGLQA